MGVQLHLLGSKKANLLIGGYSFRIGTLRRFWKVTEMNDEREQEVDRAKSKLNGKDAPLAVMIADITEMRLSGDTGADVHAHVVLGWDADRCVVTDWGWDFLPVLGYAVSEVFSPAYILHELRDGVLHKMVSERAVGLKILDKAGNLTRRGQPEILTCQTVEPYISMYAQAQCTLSDGSRAELLTRTEGGVLPDRAWYVGKRPADVRSYPVVEIS